MVEHPYNSDGSFKTPTFRYWIVFIGNKHGSAYELATNNKKEALEIARKAWKKEDWGNPLRQFPDYGYRTIKVVDDFYPKDIWKNGRIIG